MRDEDVRSSCWAALEVLSAQFGEDIPHRVVAEVHVRGRAADVSPELENLFIARD